MFEKYILLYVQQIFFYLNSNEEKRRWQQQFKIKVKVGNSYFYVFCLTFSLIRKPILTTYKTFHSTDTT